MSGDFDVELRALREFHYAGRIIRVGDALTVPAKEAHALCVWGRCAPVRDMTERRSLDSEHHRIGVR